MGRLASDKWQLALLGFSGKFAKRAGWFKPGGSEVGLTLNPLKSRTMGERKMDKKEVKATPEFKEAFALCMDYYEVTGEELEFEKVRVRANYQEAERCYLSIAEGLRKLTLRRSA